MKTAIVYRIANSRTPCWRITNSCVLAVASVLKGPSAPERKDTNYFGIKERKLEKNMEYSGKVPIFEINLEDTFARNKK